MRLSDTDKLLADHQAIIDAWYADWLAEAKAHADAVWANSGRAAIAQSDASRKRGE